jgi:hypothetical protein
MILREYPVFLGIAERAGRYGMGRHILIVLRVKVAQWTVAEESNTVKLIVTA